MRKFLILVVLFISNTAHASGGGGEQRSAAVIFSIGTTAQATPPPKINSTPALPPEKANPVSIPHFQSRPVIDGKFDDEVWANAAVLKDFYQTDPGDNTRPLHPTEVLMGL